MSQRVLMQKFWRTVDKINEIRRVTDNMIAEAQRLGPIKSYRAVQRVNQERSQIATCAAELREIEKFNVDLVTPELLARWRGNLAECMANLSQIDMHLWGLDSQYCEARFDDRREELVSE